MICFFSAAGPLVEIHMNYLGTSGKDAVRDSCGCEDGPMELGWHRRQSYVCDTVGTGRRPRLPPPAPTGASRRNNDIVTGRDAPRPRGYSPGVGVRPE